MGRLSFVSEELSVINSLREVVLLYLDLPPGDWLLSRSVVFVVEVFVSLISSIITVTLGSIRGLSNSVSSCDTAAPVS